jgi:hypothetical protein
VITVNVWEGHASFVIDASGSMPETTVSWWPRDGGLDLVFGDEPYVMPYETEVRVEAGVALKRYRLYALDDFAAGVVGAREHIGLDTADIHDWWRGWRTGIYRLRDRNCCTTVVAGLLAGGALEYTELAGHHHLDPETSFMTPGYVHRMCRAIIHGMSLARF